MKEREDYEKSLKANLTEFFDAKENIWKIFISKKGVKFKVRTITKNHASDLAI